MIFATASRAKDTAMRDAAIWVCLRITENFMFNVLPLPRQRSSDVQGYLGNEFPCLEWSGLDS